VKSCNVSQKWQEQIATKLYGQIKSRISPLLNGSNKIDYDYQALFSFISKSFEVYIETQGGKQAACLSQIKNAYEVLLKLSIDQIWKQSESLRNEAKNLGHSKHVNPKS